VEQQEEMMGKLNIQKSKKRHCHKEFFPFIKRLKILKVKRVEMIDQKLMMKKLQLSNLLEANFHQEIP